MKNLPSLEALASEITKTFSFTVPEQTIQFNPEGKSSKELKTELESISSQVGSAVQKYDLIAKQFNEQYGITTHLDVEDLRQARELISEGLKTAAFIESANSAEYKIRSGFTTALANEAGFVSEKEAVDEKNALENKRFQLAKKFLGRLRFKSELNKLNSQIHNLYDIIIGSYDVVDPFKSPSINEKNAFKKNIVNLFNDSTSQLFSGYRDLFEENANAHADNIFGNLRPLSQEVINSLLSDYTEKFFWDKLNEKLALYVNPTDSYSRKNLHDLEDPELVSEALDIFKQSLENPNQLFVGVMYSEEEEARVRSLQERREALPYVFSDIFSHSRSDNTVLGTLTDFVSSITDAEESLARKRLMNSISKVVKTFSDNLSDNNIDYKIRSHVDDLAEEAQSIKSAFMAFKPPLMVKNVDMDLWSVFKNNSEVQNLYGDATLNSFNSLLREGVFESLLSTPEHTNESVKLGYQAIWFKDPESIIYNTMNFWREPGYSGERPFLSIHESNTKNTLGVNYLLSLTVEELAAVENLKVPGIMELITAIRNDPENINSREWVPDKIDGERVVYHNVHNAIQENLAVMVNHYFENGNSNQRYFAASLIPHINFQDTEEHNVQRVKIIEKLSEIAGLDESGVDNFKENYSMFIGHLRSNLRKSGDISQIRYPFSNISKYFNSLKELIKNARDPELVQTTADAMQDDSNYINLLHKDLPNLVEFLRGYDELVVQDQLNHPEYKKIFEHRLWKTKETIFRSSNTPEDVYGTVISDFSLMKQFLDESNKIIQDSNVADILKAEQERVLDTLSGQDIVKGFSDHLSEYFKAIDNDNVASLFNQKDKYQKNSLEYLAKAAHDFNESLVVPIIRCALSKGITQQEASSFKDYISSITEYVNFNSALSQMKLSQGEIFDFLYSLSLMGYEGKSIVEFMDKQVSAINEVQESMSFLDDAGLKPTRYLIRNLMISKNPGEAIDAWNSVLESFNHGGFESDNELHRNLEYTHFRMIVDHEKVRKHVKNHFSFSDYLTIFDKKDNETQDPFSKRDRFEIECVAEEAKVLRDYVMQVKEVADSLGREMFVIPNLSYGYLPTSPLVEEFEQEGINTVIGVKIGSTESHNNKEVLNSRLFKGHRSEFANEQPIILVVDGTQHLVARDDGDKAARYPDAYQGYLNQAIAMNDAMGFSDLDYSHAGKSEEDMSRLRASSDFQRLVGVYKHVADQTSLDERKPFQFGLWNTAGIDLIIRNYHAKISEVAPTSAEEIRGPAMIFCNVGLLDDQISAEVKAKYEGLTHLPAYFDDSGKIINFDFGHDEFGVRYLNTLETEVKKEFGMKQNNPINHQMVSSLINYVKNHIDEKIGYDRPVASK
jgi:hypothetical protein